MATHDELQDFPDLPHLLGTDLYTELFSSHSGFHSGRNNTSESNSLGSEDLPFPSDIDPNVIPSNYQHTCQQSRLKDHSNPQTFHDLSILQFGLHPDNFQSFQAMTCPLNTDAYAEPVFNCDCGKTFNNLESVIAHRETDAKHKPWHGIWEAQGRGVCLCGRSFDHAHTLRHHIRLAEASLRHQQWVKGNRRIKFQGLQAPTRPRQKNRPFNIGKIRELEEAAKLQRHVKNIDMLIVEGTMRQLVQDKEEIAKTRWQTKKRISQKQRKQLEKERAEKGGASALG